MDYTKIDVAEAHIRTAVKLFFDDAHPIPIHLLACSAREILTKLGGKMGVATILDDVASARGATTGEVEKKAREFVNFMKHADRDPAATLTNFSDRDNDPVLFFACQDFGRVAGGMPIEAQVYEAWFFATVVKQVSRGGVKWQRIVKNCIKRFPGVRSASRADQKRIGRRVLEEALMDESLRMEFSRVVQLTDP
jgi:hypothetical protein